MEIEIMCVCVCVKYQLGGAMGGAMFIIWNFTFGHL